jgi:hypothetical protein
MAVPYEAEKEVAEKIREVNDTKGSDRRVQPA